MQFGESTAGPLNSTKPLLWDASAEAQGADERYGTPASAELRTPEKATDSVIRIDRGRLRALLDPSGIRLVWARGLDYASIRLLFPRNSHPEASEDLKITLGEVCR